MRNFMINAARALVLGLCLAATPAGAQDGSQPPPPDNQPAATNNSRLEWGLAGLLGFAALLALLNRTRGGHRASAIDETQAPRPAA